MPDNESPSRTTRYFDFQTSFHLAGCVLSICFGVILAVTLVLRLYHGLLGYPLGLIVSIAIGFAIVFLFIGGTILTVMYR